MVKKKGVAMNDSADLRFFSIEKYNLPSDQRTNKLHWWWQISFRLFRMRSFEPYRGGKYKRGTQPDIDRAMVELLETPIKDIPSIQTAKSSVEEIPIRTPNEEPFEQPTEIYIGDIKYTNFTIYDAMYTSGRASLLLWTDYPDEILIHDFKEWLKTYRAKTGEELPSYSEGKLEQWYENRILAYADLLLWQKWTGYKITQATLIDLIYPNHHRQDATRPLKSTVSDYKKAFNYHTATSLRRAWQHECGMAGSDAL